MTISLKHAFTNPKSDGGDTTVVRPSDWNDEHDLTLAAGKVLGRDTSGAGAAQELPIQVNTTGQVAIGTPIPDALLTVSANTVATPTPTSNTYWHFVGADAAAARMLIDVFGGNFNYTIRRAQGTAASPTALTSGMTICTIGSVFGYGTTGYSASNRLGIAAVTTEAWTDSVQGAYWSFSVTKTGGTTTAAAAAIYSYGITTVGNLSTKAPVTQTGTSYTVLEEDSSIVFNTSGTHTLTLPAASSYSGRWLHLKNIAAFAINSASSNVVPLTSGTAGTAILTAAAGQWATLQSDGTNWIKMAGS